MAEIARGRTSALFYNLWLHGVSSFCHHRNPSSCPIHACTPGCLEFGPSLISLVMTFEAASQVFWPLLAFPVLQRRLGTKGALQTCRIAYPFTFSEYILLNYLRKGSQAATTWFWVVRAIETPVAPGVAMSFTAAQLALNDVAPSSHVLGTLNVIALAISSAIRSVSPGSSAALYAVGVRDQILKGHLIWAVVVNCSWIGR